MPNDELVTPTNYCPQCKRSGMHAYYEYPDEYTCKKCGCRWRWTPFEKREADVQHDPVKNPKHYTSHPSGIECIEIVQHHNFNIGNAIKYLWRQGLKGEDNSIEDLEKAQTYIGFEIARLKGEHPTKALRADSELVPISSQWDVGPQDHPYVPTGATTEGPCGYVNDDMNVCYRPRSLHEERDQKTSLPESLAVIESLRDALRQITRTGSDSEMQSIARNALASTDLAPPLDQHWSGRLPG